MRTNLSIILADQEDGKIRRQDGRVLGTQQVPAPIRPRYSPIYWDHIAARFRTADDDDIGAPGGGASTPVVDGLGSTSGTSALSANQGRALDQRLQGVESAQGNALTQAAGDARYPRTINGQAPDQDGNVQVQVGGASTPVVDALNSSSTAAALSANQGRNLDQRLQSAEGDLSVVAQAVSQRLTQAQADGRYAQSVNGISGDATGNVDLLEVFQAMDQTSRDAIAALLGTTAQQSVPSEYVFDNGDYLVFDNGDGLAFTTPL